MTATMTARVRRAIQRRALGRVAAADGFPPSSTPTPLLDALDDDELERLNELLPWQCFTVDSRGRRFGNSAWRGKREEPQAIPDRRVTLLDERCRLAGLHVVEIGCFEGVHTIALAQRAGRLTAVDSRVENVAKTLVRCGFHGHQPEVRRCDVEQPEQLATLGGDVVFHVGVLYHLRRPVEHLRMIASLTMRALLLDTHIATADSLTDTAEEGGSSYRYQRYEEHGRDDVFSGMYDHARWLLLDDVRAILADSGFSTEVIEQRDERNGPRVLIYAERITGQEQQRP